MYGKGMEDAFIGFMVVVGAVCFAAGAAVLWLAPVVWAWVKPFIHALTA